MPSPKIISPGSATNTTEAIDNKVHADITTLIREGVSAIAIGALAGVLFWSAVLGMVDDFTSAPIIPIQVAMEAQSHGR